MIRDFGSFTRRGLLADLERPAEMWWGQIAERAGGGGGVYKMDTTGAIRTLHDRELSGRKAGNLKEVGLGWINGGRKDHGFGLGKIRGGGEQLF